MVNVLKTLKNPNFMCDAVPYRYKNSDCFLASQKRRLVFYDLNFEEICSIVVDVDHLIQLSPETCFLIGPSKNYVLKGDVLGEFEFKFEPITEVYRFKHEHSSIKAIINTQFMFYIVVADKNNVHIIKNESLSFYKIENVMLQQNKMMLFVRLYTRTLILEVEINIADGKLGKMRPKKIPESRYAFIHNGIQVLQNMVKLVFVFGSHQSETYVGDFLNICCTVPITIGDMSCTLIFNFDGTLILLGQNNQVDNIGNINCKVEKATVYQNMVLCISKTTAFCMKVTPKSHEIIHYFPAISQVNNMGFDNNKQLQFTSCSTQYRVKPKIACTLERIGMYKSTICGSVEHVFRKGCVEIITHQNYSLLSGGRFDKILGCHSYESTIVFHTADMFYFINGNNVHMFLNSYKILYYERYTLFFDGNCVAVFDGHHCLVYRQHSEIRNFTISDVRVNQHGEIFAYSSMLEQHRIGSVHGFPETDVSDNNLPMEFVYHDSSAVGFEKKLVLHKTIPMDDFIPLDYRGIPGIGSVYCTDSSHFSVGKDICTVADDGHIQPLKLKVAGLIVSMCRYKDILLICTTKRVYAYTINTGHCVPLDAHASCCFVSDDKLYLVSDNIYLCELGAIDFKIVESSLFDNDQNENESNNVHLPKKQHLDSIRALSVNELNNYDIIYSFNNNTVFAKMDTWETECKLYFNGILNQVVNLKLVATAQISPNVFAVGFAHTTVRKSVLIIYKICRNKLVEKQKIEYQSIIQVMTSDSNVLVVCFEKKADVYCLVGKQFKVVNEVVLTQLLPLEAKLFGRALVISDFARNCKCYPDIFAKPGRRLVDFMSTYDNFEIGAVSHNSDLASSYLQDQYDIYNEEPRPRMANMLNTISARRITNADLLYMNEAGVCPPVSVPMAGIPKNGKLSVCYYKGSPIVFSAYKIVIGEKVFTFIEPIQNICSIYDTLYIFGLYGGIYLFYDFEIEHVVKRMTEMSLITAKKYQKVLEQYFDDDCEIIREHGYLDINAIEDEDFDSFVQWCNGLPVYLK